MSEDLGTGPTSSQLGDLVPQAGIYKGFNVHVTMAGVIVARAQNITFTIDNGIGPYYEIGSRAPLYVEGNLAISGTMRNFVFDTFKMRLAMGNERDIIGADDKLLISTGTIPSDLGPDMTQEYGVQPWMRLYKFTITCECHIDGGDNFLEYKFEDCKINTYRVSSGQDDVVTEDITFVAPRVGVRIA